MNAHLPRRLWDVAVIGGGIVGISCALELQSRGRRVVVVDRGEPQARASFGNGGAINRPSILPLAGPAIWSKFLSYACNREPALKIRYGALPSIGRWMFHFLKRCNAADYARAARALNPLVAAAFEHHERLANLIGSTDLLKRDGYLKLYRSKPVSAAAALETQILAEAGVSVVELDAHRIHDMEPYLSPEFTYAKYFPESAFIPNPGRLIDRCWDAFRARGGGTVNGEVKTVECAESSVDVVTSSQRITASSVVLAAGVGAANIASSLGYKIPLAAGRGYHAHFKLRPGQRLNHAVWDVDGAYFAAPMLDGEVRLLTGVELARPDDPHNEEQLFDAIDIAQTRLPIAGRVSDSKWMGSRPMTPDGLPVIGRAPRHPRLYFAFGHGPSGYSMGPVTGRIVADLICDETPPISISSFSSERFQ